MMLTEGQMSDHKGARLMFDALPKAKTLIADKGYDSDAFRKALTERGTQPCIPPRRNRKTPIDYDKALYRQRHKVETFSPNSRTGAASQPAMTVVPTPSSQQSASPQASLSISINES